ncbi:MAG: cytochrome c peroxidase [Chitinophagales bacterium]
MIFISFTLLLTACKKESGEEKDFPFVPDYPAGFPEIKSPKNNQLTVMRVELGRQLFLDKRLSRDSSVACVSCHLPEKALTDGLALSEGVEGRKGIRNAPTLFNIGYHPYFFKDGGVPTLEAQVISPVEDENEMDFSIPGAVDRLKGDANYAALAEKAYERPFDAFVLTRAIAAFERTLLSGNSKFDQVTANDTSALNESEKRGLKLFFSEKTQCSTCHSGFDFTDYSFRNNGLYAEYPDKGRERISINPDDNGKFKVPSLRNVEHTAPYMFDGSLSTLEEVVEHYASGGKGHPNQDELINGFEINTEEKQDLINFLKALSDTKAINAVKNQLQ